MHQQFFLSVPNCLLQLVISAANQCQSCTLINANLLYICIPQFFFAASISTSSVFDFLFFCFDSSFLVFKLNRAHLRDVPWPIDYVKPCKQSRQKSTRVDWAERFSPVSLVRCNPGVVALHGSLNH
jgi:hypothetical protein